MFWQRLRVGMIVIVCLLAGVVFVVWLDEKAPSTSSSVVVPPANSGQQKQFY